MEEHSRPFAMGKVLAIEGEELDLQWYGNYHELCTGTYRPCWLQHSEDKYYYKPNKTNKSHAPYTTMTTDTIVLISSVIMYGFALNDNDKLSDKILRAVSNDPNIEWEYE
jgi:hypothetical protein